MGAKAAIKDGTVLVDGHEIAGQTSTFRVSVPVQAADCTSLGDGGHQRQAAGLVGGEWTLDTYRDAAEEEPDAVLFGTENVLVAGTISRPAASGDVAYLQRALRASYERGAQVGDLDRLAARFQPGSVGVARGAVIDNLTNQTLSGTSAVHQLTAAVGARMLASLHLIRADGTSPTLDCDLERDAVAIASFDQLTAAGDAAYLEFDATADDMYRLNFTIGGTSPDLDFIAFVGIKA